MDINEGEVKKDYANPHQAVNFACVLYGDYIMVMGGSIKQNKNKKIIKIHDKKRETCFCPFVNHKFTSIDFCNCSIGWQKETYESILGKPVEVNIEESVLRGGKRCSFTIKFA